MKIKVAYVDREWGQCKEKRIVGDMGFTFCDRPETVTVNINELKDNIKNWINSSDCEIEGDTFDDVCQQFAIYPVYVTTAQSENEKDIFWDDVDLQDAKLTDVYVCASKNIAGWVKELYEGSDVTIHFRAE